MKKIPPPSRPKLINGKVWVPSGTGYRLLPEDDPSYKETFNWIDSQRFVELLDWVYNKRNGHKNGHNGHNGYHKNGHNGNGE